MPTRRDMIRDLARNRGSRGLEPDRAGVSGTDSPRGRPRSATAGFWSSSSSTAATTRSTRSCRSPTRIRAKPQDTAAPGKAADPGQRSRRLAPGAARAGGAPRARSPRAGPGRRLSQPQPLALREHGDLADGPARSGGAWRPGLDRPRPRRAGTTGRDADRGRGAAALYIGDGHAAPALRGRRAGAASLERIEDLMLPAGWDAFVRWTGSAPRTEPDDGLTAYVRRSVLDAYASPNAWPS